MRRESLIYVGLLVLALVSFWPVGHLGFIIYDDWDFVFKNTVVQKGITAEGLRWALSSGHTGNWHPLTWLSHMLDCQLFGLKASGHHWTNLGFHIANTLLLFAVLKEMTGTVWRGALVAALFACHPAHVQSVAWISERKDVLSGFLALLTLWAYVRYSRRKSVTRYLITLLFFTLGLMSKPMLVTLPFVLLLLDFWPLGRWQPVPSCKKAGPFSLRSVTGNLQQLIIEKVPFLALCLATGIITLRTQSMTGAVVSMDSLPWYWRIANALVFYTTYLGKLFWPQNLSIFYPYTRMDPWAFVGSGLLPIFLSFFCMGRARSRPYMPVGWFWFLLMLLPVIGFVQVSLQSVADRYTYLPSIGLFIIVAWGIADVASISNRWRLGMVLGAAALVLACLLDTRHQLKYWKNSVTLFTHSVEVTRENNFEGYFLLGNAFGDSGDLEGAARSYRSALRIAPKFKEAHYQLGYVLFLQKKFEEAEVEFGEAVRLTPHNAYAHKYLADTLSAQGKVAEAEAEYSAALQLMPDNQAIREALALATKKSETESALASLYEALKDHPTPEAHAGIASLRTTQGQYEDAVEHYLEALRLKPDSPEILNNLAWLLATCPDAHIRNGTQAVQYAARACDLTGHKQIIMVGTLAAAYAEAGRYEDAVGAAEQAVALATVSGEKDLAEKNRQLLEIYRSRRPYYEATKP